MEKGYINFNDSDLHNVTSHLNTSCNNISDVGTSTSNNFSSFNKANIYSNGICTINRQLSSIANSVSNIRQIVLKSEQEMNDAENRLASRAELIEIPRDFVTNDSSRNKEFDAISLSKKDGRSVNGGEALTNTKEEFTSSVTYDNNLKNVLNSNSLEVEKIHDINLNKVDLNNVNNNFNVHSENLDFDESLDKAKLGNINTGVDSRVQEIDSNTIIQNVNLVNNFNDMSLDNANFDMNIYKDE